MSKYNAETIQEIARMVAKMVSTELSEPEHIGELEREMLHLSQEINRRALEILLNEQGSKERKKSLAHVAGRSSASGKEERQSSQCLDV